MNVDTIKAMGRPKGLPFRIGKLGHVGMYVKDLERSARFYTEILGFQVSDAIASPSTVRWHGRWPFICSRLEVPPPTPPRASRETRSAARPRARP